MPAPAQNDAQVPSAPWDNQSAPAQPTCGEYCPKQPHVQCVGDWNISGVYPNCSCDFVCKSEPAAANETDIPQNVSQTPVNETEEPLAVPVNKTISQLLDDGLERARTSFYRNNSGLFTERSYRWLRIPGNNSPDEIPLGASPATDIKFDGAVIDSAIASAFVVFESGDSEINEAYGLAIFKAKQTPLDNYTGSDAFSVDFFSPIIDKKLRDCWTYGKDYSIASGGDWILTYFFRCETIYDK